MPNRAQSNSLNTLTSPATDDLNLKIASVKNVWEDRSTLYEHRSSTSQLVSSSATVSVSESLNEASSGSSLTSQSQQLSTSQQQQHYQNFSSVAESISSSVELPVSQDSLSDTGISLAAHHQPTEISVPDLGSNANEISHADLSSSPLSYDPSISHKSKMQLPVSVSAAAAIAATAAAANDQSNVCKVKPQLNALAQPQQQQQQPQQQQQQTAQQQPTSPAAQVMAASPPAAAAAAAQQMSQVIIAAAAQQVSQQYHPFQISSQLFTAPQETRGFSQQQNFYNLNAAQTGQAQPAPLPPTYSQHSLFLQPAAAAAAAAPSHNDVFQSSQLPAYRNQFGQSQQSTIMVSSATSSLMSAAIKPPSVQSQLQNQYSKCQPMM